MAYTWDGSGWTVSSPANVEGASDRLTGVSCVSARVCMAVGNYTDNVYPYLHTLAESWNGSAWQIQESPTPAIFYTDDVSNISCRSQSMCLATFGSLVELWNGTSWTVQNEPFAGGNDPTVLDSVSCVAANNCTLAGYYVPNLSVDVPLVETWNGATWSMPTVPDPAPPSMASTTGVTSPESAVLRPTLALQSATGTRAEPLLRYGKADRGSCDIDLGAQDTDTIWQRWLQSTRVGFWSVLRRQPRASHVLFDWHIERAERWSCGDLFQGNKD